MKNIIIIKTIIILFMILFLFPIIASAGTYWVSPTGTAAWSNAQSATPLSGTACCSLATANSSAQAGDTVYLRGGTYSGTSLDPVNSGTGQNKITLQAYQSESVTITGVAGAALELNVDYIIVDGIVFNYSSFGAFLRKGANYNEIRNCTFHSINTGAAKGFNIYTINANCNGDENTHNWVHDNVMYDAGYITGGCNDEGWLITIGSDAAYNDDCSGYNTFENNTLYSGSHHVFKSKTKYNVIRNNFMHNEGGFVASQACEALLCTGDTPSGEYGNRVLSVLDDQDTGTPDTYVLIENNRLGEAGFPSDGNGAFNLVIGGGRVIARYNAVFNSPDVNLYFRSSGNTADDNRVYNNTFYRAGYNSVCRKTESKYGSGWMTHGIRVQKNANNNVLKNNIIFDNVGVDILDEGAGTVDSNNWISTDGDPLFANPDISDPTSTTLPDLSLQSNSGAINKGVALTTVAAADTGSGTSLIVTDALYFQDGSWGSSLSNINADWIAVGTVGNFIQISSIDYSTNTITLTGGISRNDGDSVWLVKDSSGNVVLRGSAPDIGAYESKISPPKNLRIVP